MPESWICQSWHRGAAGSAQPCPCPALVPPPPPQVVQLYETMLTRHTTMVVGPTQGGKTVIITTLQNAQTDLKLPTKIFVVNAKARPGRESSSSNASTGYGTV